MFLQSICEVCATRSPIPMLRACLCDCSELTSAGNLLAMDFNLTGMAANLTGMASNLIGMVFNLYNSDGFQPTGNGLQPNSDGLQHGHAVHGNESLVSLGPKQLKP